MCHFEQRIDVIDIDLPQPEDLDLFRVQGKDIDGCFTRAKQEIFVVLIQFIPGVLDRRLTHILGRGVAAIIVRILRLFHDCQYRLDTYAHATVPFDSWCAICS